LYRKISGVGPLEDAIDIIGGAAILVEKKRPIRDKAPCSNMETVGIDRR